MQLLKRLPLLVGVLLVLALMCSTCTLQLAEDIEDTLETPIPPTPTTASNNGGTGGNYGSDYCASTGSWDPSNPFRGWPTSSTQFHSPAYISAYFCDPNYGHSWDHEGLDFAFWGGTPVVATAEALVVNAGWDPQLGNVITICSGVVSGWCARYAHLASISVPAWYTVSPGEQIGTVGNTGAGAFGTWHLHYDITFQDNFRDPFPTLYR